jgi:hypothetical protein
MPTLLDADYEDDFETTSAPTWVPLDYAEVTVEDKISGGGVGLVHRGKIGKQRVALKTLVRCRLLLCFCKDVFETEHHLSRQCCSVCKQLH